MEIKRKKFKVVTLGCRVNIYESNGIVEQLSKRGGVYTTSDEECEIVIINTCCVTNKAETKSMYYARKYIANQNVKLIVVVGCLSQIRDLKFLDNKVGIIIGNKYKNDIYKLINSYKGERIIKITNVLREGKIEVVENLTPLCTTRAYIKIQDGCNFSCSYCVIPLARGKQRSLSHEIIIKKIKELVKNGIKEIILTGVNTAGYFDKPKYKFIDLLEDIDKLEGEFRVRISSLEPFQINDKIIELLTQNKNRWCQFFHLCLQNANDEVLKSMNRMYSVNDFIVLCARIIQKSKFASITTDYIVGYLTETKEQFENSLVNLKKLKLPHIHMFPFSLKSGTKAANFKSIVDENEKKRRFVEIEKINLENKIAYLEKFVGKNVDVLFEKSREKGYQIGHSQYFFTVKIKTNLILEGEMTCVRITKLIDTQLIGEVSN